MKKVILIMFTMGLFLTGFTSCRDTAKDEPVEEAVDKAGDKIEETADEVGDKVENAAEEVDQEI